MWNLGAGQILAVVGSSQFMGSWNVEKAILLEQMPGDAWSTDLFLPAEDGLEFKVQLCDASKRNDLCNLRLYTKHISFQLIQQI